jgi:hypothetical protein
MRELDWVLESIVNGFDPVTVADTFAPAFLAKVPVDQFVAMSGQLQSALRGFVVEKVDEQGPAATAVLLLPTGDRWRARIHVDGGRIDGLFFQPAPDLAPEPAAKSWDEFDAKLAVLASRTGFLAAEVVDGTVRPIHAVNPDRRLALGSAFKLYVLGALAAAEPS